MVYKNIPKYTWCNLYIANFVKNSNGIYVRAGDYNLVFYDKSKENKENKSGEVHKIYFSSFNSAYSFILENNITVYNLHFQGSYINEIKQYEKEILNKGQLLLF